MALSNKELLHTIGYGVLLVGSGALFWIVAGAMIATLKFMAGY